MFGIALKFKLQLILDINIEVGIIVPSKNLCLSHLNICTIIKPGPPTGLFVGFVQNHLLQNN